MPDWTPTSTGQGWVAPYILEPLEPVRDKLVVVTGLDHHELSMPGEPPGGHGSGTGAFLTMRPVFRNENDPDRTSLDQVIAQQGPAACNRPLLDGQELPYRLYVPENNDPAVAYPLVLYLHHAGLAGTDQNNDSGWDN